MNGYRYKMMDNQLKLDNLSTRLNKLLRNINSINNNVQKSNTVNDLTFY